MGEKKRKEQAKNQSFIFEWENYKFMLIGAALIQKFIAGDAFVWHLHLYLLVSGLKSTPFY